jgi:hypothetical protein
MSQHVEWASGLGGWTVNPGEWVDGYGSRNLGVAIWAGDGDGTILEFGSKEEAVKQLRAYADVIERARDTSRYDECRWCEARIVLVPEYMDGPKTQWVHLGEIGPEAPTTCDADGTQKDISPAHQFVDDVCRVCGNAREDDDQVCIPTEDEEAGA